MNKWYLRKVIAPLILFATCFCSSAYGMSEEERKFLLMYFEEELVSTPVRTPKPISQVAENITVITCKEIEQMNAHTLTDVLNTIPGIQMDIRGGPGSTASARIQGSEFKHVLVMIDGVTMNNLSDSFADVSAIPVQHI
ncbi:MAG: TonB-dependent receptor plug domain-containing protein, partial [Nitrospirota bacterium]|nr:TonB-dependent receptor plug domain-containing protein [Nitrospirota bacterium]